MNLPLEEQSFKLTDFYTSGRFLPAPFPFKLVYRHDNNLPLYTHAHDFFQICYVLKGSCFHSINGLEAVLCKGDLFSVPPYLYHSLQKIRDQEVLIAQIDFLPGFLQEQLKYTEQLEEIVDFAYLHPLLGSAEHVLPKLNLQPDSQQEVEQSIMRIDKEMEARRPMYQLAVRAEMLKLLIVAGREFNGVWEGKSDRGVFQSRKEALIKAIRYIEAHCTDPLNLAAAAEQAYMSPAYFSSVFKTITGQNFTQYVNSLRVRKSLELLKNSDMSITGIYSMCGFNSASHFIGVFKKHTGLTPSAFRKLSC